MFSKSNFKKIIKNPSYIFTYAHIFWLYRYPRYKKGISKIFGKELLFVDSASLVFMYKEIFEKEVYKFISKSEKPYIVDCGSNIGLSLIYFSRLFPKAEIVAFEPDKDVFYCLDKNINNFSIGNVSLFNCAVWNKEETLRFFSEGADGGRVAIESDNDKIVEVKAVRLGNYLNREVDFLKIDIEGSEFEVLEDCASSLVNVKNIFVEYHSFVDRTQNLDKILNILTNAGFRYYIEHIGIRSDKPFVKVDSHLSMDLQLNIYGYRV